MTLCFLRLLNNNLKLNFFQQVWGMVKILKITVFFVGFDLQSKLLPQKVILYLKKGEKIICTYHVPLLFQDEWFRTKGSWKTGEYQKISENSTKKNLYTNNFWCPKSIIVSKICLQSKIWTKNTTVKNKSVN